MLKQFAKCSKFGPILMQLELLVQQFHQIFFNGFEGITIRGTPKLCIDVSDVQYIVGGAFNKSMRKSADEEKYFGTRGRVKEEDAEVSGSVISRENSDEEYV